MEGSFEKGRFSQILTLKMCTTPRSVHDRHTISKSHYHRSRHACPVLVHVCTRVCEGAFVPRSVVYWFVVILATVPVLFRSGINFKSRVGNRICCDERTTNIQEVIVLTYVLLQCLFIVL